jgi:superfamily II DNA or RNA helicase
MTATTSILSRCRRGAGKTRVGLAIAADVVASGGHVLWLAKSWGHLQQALNERAQRACAASDLPLQDGDQRVVNVG